MLRIREIRKERGMSQAALARAIGVAQSSVSDFENNVCSPRLDVFRLIAQTLHCPMEDLFSDNDNMSEVG